MKAFKIFTVAALAFSLMGSTQTMASKNTPSSSSAWERVLTKKIVNSFRTHRRCQNRCGATWRRSADRRGCAPIDR